MNRRLDRNGGYRKGNDARKPPRWAAAAPVIAAWMLAGFLLFGVTACGTALDISAYGQEPIAITGLGEPFSVTPEELMSLDCVHRKDTGATAKAGTVDAYGPLMTTFLAAQGYQMEDVDRIRFYCKDNYKITLKDEYLTDYDIVLSVASGSQALEEQQQPLRLLIPEAESAKWAYGVTSIEFVLAE